VVPESGTTMLLTMYCNERPTRKLHSFTFIVSNQRNLLFLIRCYRVGGYEVFHFAPQFRKSNNINFSFGPGCRWYVKQKMIVTRVGVKLAMTVSWKGSW
jgi:hypothetical protein